MKDSIVPIDTAGRVVLPKHIRVELAINAGDMLQVSVRGSEVTLSPKREVAGFVKRKRALVFSTGTDQVLEPEAVAATLDEVRGQRCAEIERRIPSRFKKR